MKRAVAMLVVAVCVTGCARDEDAATPGADADATRAASAVQHEPAAAAAAAAQATAPAPAASAAADDVAGPTGAPVAVGSDVPPWPAGLVEVAGACVGVADPEAPCAVGIATLAPAEGAQATWLVARTAAGGGGDGPRWTVSDVLAAPDVPDGASLEIAGCRVDGFPAPSVIAVVRFVEGEAFSRDVTWSRRVGGDGRFAPLAGGTRVDCADPAAGL